MELDEIKNLWAESNRNLEASMRLNSILMQQSNLRKTETSLQSLARSIALEVIVNVIGVVLIGVFISSNLNEPRFIVPAALIDIYFIALIVAGARQLAELRGIDYDEPVVAIQTRLERLRLRRIWTTLATLLFAPLMWVPFMIVGLRAVFGADAYAGGAAWLAGNVLFGLAVIPVAIFLARRYGSRLAASKPMRALADSIAGHSLKSAMDSLDSIRRFEEC
ncbi:MAG TPA: hypothetical protein VHT92_05110 [Candidatus Cybelea sp.]|nr:hypothetical protein [Candidatus Cybelea sp.]